MVPFNLSAHALGRPETMAMTLLWARGIDSNTLRFYTTKPITSMRAPSPVPKQRTYNICSKDTVSRQTVGHGDFIGRILRAVKEQKDAEALEAKSSESVATERVHERGDDDEEDDAIANVEYKCIHSIAVDASIVNSFSCSVNKRTLPASVDGEIVGAAPSKARWTFSRKRLYPRRELLSSTSKQSAAHRAWSDL